MKDYKNSANNNRDPWDIEPKPSFFSRFKSRTALSLVAFCALALVITVGALSINRNVAPDEPTEDLPSASDTVITPVIPDKPIDPMDDPMYNGNAMVGGGANQPDDGPGDFQPVNPMPTTSKKSSGTGGVDHVVTDANGGTTFNGNPPALDPIEVTKDTTVTDCVTGETTNTADELNDGWIADPTATREQTDPDCQPADGDQDVPDAEPTGHKITVKYVDSDGNELAPSVEKYIEIGEHYTVTAPAIPGWVPANNVTTSETARV